jgi:hypothetical protein
MCSSAMVPFSISAMRVSWEAALMTSSVGMMKTSVYKNKKILKGGLPQHRSKTEKRNNFGFTDFLFNLWELCVLCG